MSVTLTIDLPEDVRNVLGNAAKEEGMQEGEYAARALRAYLFMRRFRRLRERLAAESKAIHTDDDIFDLVS
jgi:hypothetical protein